MTKIFGEGEAAVTAVNGVDITIREGELAVITGDSGSGKTTLVSLLGCILRPSSGEVWIGGSRVDFLKDDLPRIRRERVGFVFQMFNLIPYLTALENVIVAMELAGNGGIGAEKKAKELLDRMGLSERLHHRPGQLSGGEKQRVSFARALANDPSVIFADEPTANLDSHQSSNLMSLIRETQKEKGTTTVIITHQVDLLGDVDRVIRMKDGKIISDTTP